MENKIVTLEQAGKQAMQDLNDLGGKYLSGMNFLVMSPDGQHCGFSSRANTHYSYITESMNAPENAERIMVPITQRWRKSHNGTNTTKKPNHNAK